MRCLRWRLEVRVKRQLFRYEYVCDGSTIHGSKCVNTKVIEAYDSADSDYRICQIQDDVTGFIWTSLRNGGWLCTALHRDDPRDRRLS